MKKYKIGVLSPSDIAYRRMVPAILNSRHFEYAGIAMADIDEWPGRSESHLDKCESFIKNFGGNLYESYTSLIEDETIDAVYIPLPPSEHLKWAEKVFAAGKHVLVEKPSATSYEECVRMIELAEKSDCALHEDYAYQYHNQVKVLDEIVNSGRIGDLRLIKATFSFPYRGESDFRYHANRGGGALTDCAGYPINFVSRYLGTNAKVICAEKKSSRGHDVDTYGSATITGDSGVAAQISWGMDNVYRCMAELHGSDGIVTVDRLYTPPADLDVVIKLHSNAGAEEIRIGADNQFVKSLECFCDCIEDSVRREQRFKEIKMQAELVQEVMDF